MLFNAIYHVCTCVDIIKQKYMQKSVHKLFKKAKMGAGGAGRGRGVGWIRQGIESLWEQR
jgi:hypothetical protein